MSPGTRRMMGSASTNSFIVFVWLVFQNWKCILRKHDTINFTQADNQLELNGFDKDWTFLYSRVYSEFDMDGQELRPKTNKGRRALHWNIFPNTRQGKRGGQSGNDYVVVQSWVALAFFLTPSLSFCLFKEGIIITIIIIIFLLILCDSAKLGRPGQPTLPWLQKREQA